jgi:Chromo (CHRromatin Organisation MOdifier) domain
LFHVSNLRPYHPDQNVDRAQIKPHPIQLQDGATEYDVERIVRHRVRDHQTEYLLQWTGYPSRENIWQMSDDLSNAPDALADYCSDMYFGSLITE